MGAPMLDAGLRSLLAAALFVALLAAGQLARADPPVSPSASTPCLEAIVSPVSGYAECVNPRGAPVAPAPPRPPVERAPQTDSSETTVEPER